jgi:methylenetetrahydrofolate reductase (NADPH)
MTKICELLAGGPTVSFEFFPPKTDDGMRALAGAVAELAPSHPSFVSVTYGAGGTTRDRTRDLVIDLNARQPFPAMAHLTCVGHTRSQVKELLDDYVAGGVHNILALAGDPPADGSPDAGEFRYALELVELVRAHGDFCVAVSAFPEVHPRSTSRSSDRRHLADKLRIADFGITQFFFDADDYFRLTDELEALGVTTPVLPGVIPVLNPGTIRRFCALNGTSVPEDLFARLEALPDEAARLPVAVEATVALCQRLLDAGVPGLHFYTLNRAEAVERILADLGLAG